jgi:hypothetical protein
MTMKTKTRSAYSKTRRFAPRSKGRERGQAAGPACPFCGDPGNIWRMLNEPTYLYCHACSNFFYEKDIMAMAEEWAPHLSYQADKPLKTK